MRPSVLVGALVLFDLALSATVFAIVRRYYETHVPHFDAIGGYISAFNVMNRIRDRSLLHALPDAFDNGLSWLYPLNGILWSWSTVRSPELLVLLNIALLFIAQLAIKQYGSVVGWGPRRIFLVALLPLVPGHLFVWDAGIQDLRRDIQQTLLLFGCFFLALAYAVRPTRWSGLVLGVLVGLTQWARDNAMAMIVIVTLPAIVVAIARHRWRSVGIAVLPFAAFLVLVVPYYALTLEHTLYRYRYIVWGPGEGRLASLAAWWTAPYHLLLADDARYFGSAALGQVSVGLFLVTALLFGGALLRRIVVWTPSAWHVHSCRLLVGAGAWIVCAVIVYTTLVLGYGRKYDATPLQPIVVGLVALLAGAAELFTRKPPVGIRPERGTSVALLAVLAATLLVGNAVRMQAGRHAPEDPDLVSTVRDASIAVGDLANGRPVAVLWVDTFSRHHVNYYVAQAGRTTPRNPEVIAFHAGDPFDLDQPLRRSDDPVSLQGRMRHALRRYADFVVVCEDTSQYANPRADLWPYRIGRPVVDELLQDPAFSPISRFAVNGLPFVVLENWGER